MDNTLLVAIIGAVTALVSVCITTVLGFLTWSRNIRFQILRDERDRLEKKFNSALDLFSEGLAGGTINGRLAAMCNHEFPSNVRKEFNRIVDEKTFASEDEMDKKVAYFTLAHEMSKAINEYNLRIQETSEIVDKQFAVELAKNVIRTGLLKW